MAHSLWFIRYGTYNIDSYCILQFIWFQIIWSNLYCPCMGYANRKLNSWRFSSLLSPFYKPVFNKSIEINWKTWTSSFLKLYNFTFLVSFKSQFIVFKLNWNGWFGLLFNREENNLSPPHLLTEEEEVKLN